MIRHDATMMIHKRKKNQWDFIKCKNVSEPGAIVQQKGTYLASKADPGSVPGTPYGLLSLTRSDP